MDDFAFEKLTVIANEVYETGAITRHMKTSVFVTIPKINGTLECKKFRTISIMSQITKIVLRVIIHRITNKLRDEIAVEQYGFLAGKGTSNAIFVVRNLMERAIEKQKDVFMCFIDYKKAFDRFKHVGRSFQYAKSPGSRWKRPTLDEKLLLEPKGSCNRGKRGEFAARDQERSR